MPTQKPLKYQQNKGYTLLELMVVVAIISIIAGATLPGLQDLLVQYKLHTIQKELVYFINMSKAQALSYNKSFYICGASSDGKQCNSDIHDFKHGILLVDKNKTFILLKALYNSKHNIKWNGFNKEFRIYPNGTMTNANGRFYVCYKGKLYFQVFVSRQVRARVGSRQENQKDSAKYCAQEND
jgi:type IV fimbrial biogenesis protein FimT